jgi:hypothetical protein
MLPRESDQEIVDIFLASNVKGRAYLASTDAE